MRKLYGVNLYIPEIETEKITKETKLFYHVESGLKFYEYKTRILKNQAALTPQDAIDKAINSKEEKIASLREKIAGLQADINLIEKLGDEL